jgi:glycosyltransferase involved in cell wall biosynthesis
MMPAHVIPTGIDTALFETLPARRDIDIMGAGSLIPLKQYSLFIDVIKSISNDFPNVKAVICGKGPEMESLKKQVARLKLEDNIELKGELPHPEILALMQRSKVFLHTSSYEGYSTVLSEALYAGCQVVSLVNAMNQRPAQHHVPDNAEQLPGMIRKLLSDEQLSHERVLVYSTSIIAQKMTGLFIKQATADMHQIIGDSLEAEVLSKMD